MRSLTLYGGILVAFSISFPTNPVLTGIAAGHPLEYKREVGQILPPKGYTRPVYTANSFAAWLRKLPLRSNSKVYLYNGKEKMNQSAQFAVIDLPIGSKNLQQCADVCMRLRADYLRSAGRENEITFFDNASRAYNYPDYKKRTTYDGYLETVFNWCGTLSLEKQLKKIKNNSDIKPGDVIIDGGSPGHAVIVVDMVVNANGQKLFLLAQGYMPAQDIHILNTHNHSGSPWYSISSQDVELQTPEWTFKPLHVRSWE
jgi:hypothetical protein